VDQWFVDNSCRFIDRQFVDRRFIDCWFVDRWFVDRWFIDHSPTQEVIRERYNPPIKTLLENRADFFLFCPLSKM